MDFLTLPAVQAVLGLLLLVLLVAVVVYLRLHSVRHIEPPPVAERRPSGALLDDAPRFEDLVPGEIATQASYSSQLQTASFNLRIEAVQDRMLYVVNGVSYNSLDDIPDPELRNMARKLQDKTMPGGPPVEPGDPASSLPVNEVIRQVLTGNQAIIETQTPAYNVRIQQQGNQTQYIVNGLTYDSLNEIPDPDLRRKAQELLGKMV